MKIFSVLYNLLHRHGKKVFFLVGAVSLVLPFFAVSYSLAFVGPVQSPGVGSGVIASDAANNIAIGGSATQANTKFLLKAPAVAEDYALKILKSDGITPIFFVRNDGKISIATTSVIGTLTVDGTIYSTNNFVGSVSASNVTAGVFGAGNFSFPSSLGINTSTQVGLPQSLSVYGGGYISGNVGIGTTSPNTRLDVRNNVSNGVVMQVRNNNIEGFSEIEFYNYNNAITGVIGYGNTNAGASGFFQRNKFYVGTEDASTPLVLMTNHLSRVHIATDGNVGIGTNDPKGKLSIVSPTPNRGTIEVFNLDYDDNDIRFDGGTDSLFAFWNYGSTSTGATWFRSTTVNPILYMENSGNVGIGTSTPSSKLTVSGNIYATGNITCGGVCGGGSVGSGSISTSSPITAFNFPYWATAGGGLSGTSTIFYSSSTRNVGIGTASPGAKLHISGSVGAATLDARIVNTESSGAAGWRAYGNTANFVEYGSGGSTRGDILQDRGYMIDIGSDLVFSAFTAGKDIIFAAGGGLTAGTEKMRLTSAGKVGIGTAAPNSVLNIAGVAPELTLSDTSAGTDLKHWYMQSSGGSFNIAPTSDAFVSGKFPAIKITPEGNVLIKQATVVDFPLPISALGVGGDISLSGLNGTRRIKVEPTPFSGDGGSLVISAADGKRFAGDSYYGFAGGSVSITAGSSVSSDPELAEAGGAINITAGNSGYIAGASVVLNGGTGSTSGNVLLASLRGNVGIGTGGANAKLQVTGGDVAITTPGKGIILKATDGANCYRVTVNNAGILATASVTCP